MFELNRKEPAQPDSPDTRGPAPARDPLRANSPPQAGIAVIGRSITIDGHLRGDEDLRVEGNITGTIQLPNSNLIIGKEGRIKADVYAKSVVVDGEMTGDLYGSECVGIRASARVEGNVVASRVTLEEGARFKGSIDMDPENVEAALGTKRAQRAAEPHRSTAGPVPAAVAAEGTGARGGKHEQAKAEPAH